MVQSDDWGAIDLVTLTQLVLRQVNVSEDQFRATTGHVLRDLLKLWPDFLAGDAVRTFEEDKDVDIHFICEHLAESTSVERADRAALIFV